MIDIVKNGLQKIREEQKNLRREVMEKTVGYIVAALGLVAGLAWNDAIRSAIEYFFPMSSKGILAKLIYAVAITALIVFVSVYLLRLTEKKAEKREIIK